MPVREPAPGERDLVALPPRRGVRAVVVASEQQHDLVAVGVAEHAQQYPVPGILDGAAKPELEETATELLALLRMSARSVP